VDWFKSVEGIQMARASKMGADAATRDSNRAQVSGHICEACGKAIPQGELLMVRLVEFDGSRTRKRRRVAYHRNGSCYKTS
jgi:hypothetical protein